MDLWALVPQLYFGAVQCTDLTRQTRGLYVSDPKALNNVVVKEQHIYEEPRWFLKYVPYGHAKRFSNADLCFTLQAGSE